MAINLGNQYSVFEDYDMREFAMDSDGVQATAESEIQARVGDSDPVVESDPVTIIKDFDDVKKLLINGVENLRSLYDSRPDLVILIARYLGLSSEIGGDFLPLIMFCEAVKLKAANKAGEKTPSVSRTTRLYLAHGYRQVHSICYSSR